MKRLSKAALAIGAAVKATGAHRYRYRVHSFVHDSVVVEVYRTDEHAFFSKVKDNWVQIRPVVPVGGVRVVPSK